MKTNFQVSSYLLAILFFSIFPSKESIAQFILNGNAVALGNDCYELTPDVTSQAGQIWNTNTYNLNQPFDIQFNIMLGCKNYSIGADGMGFVFQQLSTNAGSSG